MPRTTLQRITERETSLADTAEQVRTQISELTARLRDLEAELTGPATARKIVLALGEDEPVPTTHPGLPDNPAYQHILTEAQTPLRCKDLCHALDTGTEPSRIEAMRAKLKRLVATGLVTEQAPGLFALLGIQPITLGASDEKTVYQAASPWPY